jgi:hypothetical protein
VQVWAITRSRAVCYRIKAGRSMEEAADVLGDYRGIVMCDGYAVYSSLHKQRPAMGLANCWARVGRKFVEVEGSSPVIEDYGQGSATLARRSRLTLAKVFSAGVSACLSLTPRKVSLGRMRRR